MTLLTTTIVATFSLLKEFLLDTAGSKTSSQSPVGKPYRVPILYCEDGAEIQGFLGLPA